MEKTAIYIIAHKPFPWKEKDGYKILGVGKNQDFAEVHDDKGDNIADRNRSFCELTGLYWIWKNDRSDIEGLVHYRRFFTTNILSTSPSYFLTPGKAEKILEKHDIITSKLYSFHKTIFDNRQEFCYRKDLLQLREVIQEKTPDYLKTYDAIMEGHHSFLCNMLVARKEILSGYCEWLFSILFELEKRIDSSSYEGNWARLYGYISEVLLTVYVFKNRLKYKSMAIAVTDKSFLARLKGKLKHGIRQ